MNAVLPPMTTSDAPGAKLMTVPETVIAEPGESVCPAMMNWDLEFSVIVEPPNVIDGKGFAVAVGDKEKVVPPITTLEAPGARLMGVPETVMTEPGESVCPAMTSWVLEFAVMVEPPKVMEGRGVVAGARAIVLPPTTTEAPFEATDTTVPEIVAGAPPEVRVITPGIMTAPFGPLWSCCPPTVGKGEAAPTGRGIVLVPKTTPAPLGNTDTGVPDIVIAEPPALMVVPPGRMILPFGAIWICWPATIGKEVGTPAGKATVVPPTTRPAPFDITDTTVPEIVAALAPGLSVVIPGMTMFPFVVV